MMAKTYQGTVYFVENRGEYVDVEGRTRWKHLGYYLVSTVPPFDKVYVPDRGPCGSCGVHDCIHQQVLNYGTYTELIGTAVLAGGAPQDALPGT